jgi:hypothetical protein
LPALQIKIIPRHLASCAGDSLFLGANNQPALQERYIRDRNRTFEKKNQNVCKKQSTHFSGKALGNNRKQKGTFSLDRDLLFATILHIVDRLLININILF